MTNRRARARRGPWFTFALLALLCAVPAWSQPAPSDTSTTPAVSSDGPPIPPVVGYVNDAAEVMEPASRAQLEAFLDDLHTKTGVQFAVLTMTNTAPVTPSEYKVKVFDKWGVGDKDRDDGLLMLVALEEREVRFETGYGLEGVLPDGLQSRIFREEMAPHFRENDYTGGIIAGVLACAGRIAKDKGVTLEWNGRELRYGSSKRSRSLPWWAILIIFIGFMLFVSAANTSALRGPGRRRRYGGWNDWGGGGGFGGFGGFGGGGFGGGGFGGGGGGGGGSFGGFGGGGSGGGGGGGKW